MSVYNALNKYHSIVIDDSEFVHDSHKTKHKYNIKCDKFLQVEALYLCVNTELIADDLILYSRYLLHYKSLDNLCILSSRSSCVLQKWARTFNPFRYHLYAN